MGDKKLLKIEHDGTESTFTVSQKDYEDHRFMADLVGGGRFESGKLYHKGRNRFFYINGRYDAQAVFPRNEWASRLFGQPVHGPLIIDLTTDANRVGYRVVVPK